MKKRKPAWDVLSDEQKKKCIDNIIAYFQDEWDQRIGVIAAEQVMDTVMEPAFAEIYNKGIVDAQKTIQERLADLNVDLDLLLKK